MRDENKEKEKDSSSENSERRQQCAEFLFKFYIIFEITTTQNTKLEVKAFRELLVLCVRIQNVYKTGKLMERRREK